MSSPVRGGDIDVDTSCCSDDSFREFGGEVVSTCDGLKVGEFADIIYWVILLRDLVVMRLWHGSGPFFLSCLGWEALKGKGKEGKTSFVRSFVRTCDGNRIGSLCLLTPKKFLKEKDTRAQAGDAPEK